jgi:hypothetical protein
MSRLLLAAVVLAVTAAGSAGAAAAARPLLTYALAPIQYDVGLNVGLGLCANDLHGNRFRLSDPHLDSTPTWSRDGRLVAFTRASSSGGYDIIVTDPQGRHLRTLMHYEGNVAPSLGGWSRDSRHLAVSTYGSAPGIYIVNADGTAGHAILAAGYQAYIVRRRGRATGGAFSSRFRVTPRDTRADPTSSIRTGPTCVCSSIRHSSPRGRRTAGGSRTSRTAHPTLTAHNWPLGSPGGTEPTGKSSCPRQKG